MRHIIAGHNANQRYALKYVKLFKTIKYCGFPNNDNSHFDTETISRIIIDMRRGKEGDIDRLTAQHLQHSHPVVSVLLSIFSD